MAASVGGFGLAAQEGSILYGLILAPLWFSISFFNMVKYEDTSNDVLQFYVLGVPWTVQFFAIVLALPFLDNASFRMLFYYSTLFTLIPVVASYYFLAVLAVSIFKHPELYKEDYTRYRVIKLLLSYFYASFLTLGALEGIPAAGEWYRIANELVTIEPYDRPTKEEVERADQLSHFAF